MKQVTLEELLNLLKQDGCELSKRTFEYYQRLELLPKPEKQVGEKGRGVYGHYDLAELRRVVAEIFKLKDRGMTLEEIKRYAEAAIIQRYVEHVNRMLPQKSWLAALKDNRQDVDNLFWWDNENTVECRALEDLKHDLLCTDLALKWITSVHHNRADEAEPSVDMTNQSDAALITKVEKSINEIDKLIKRIITRLDQLKGKRR